MKEYLLKDAAKALNINYSTAKTILRIFRLEKRVEKKNADEDKDLRLYINDYISREHNILDEIGDNKKRIELVNNSETNSTKCTNFKFIINDEEDNKDLNNSDETESEANNNDKEDITINDIDKVGRFIEAENLRINKPSQFKNSISSKNLNQMLSTRKNKFSAPRRINSCIDTNYADIINKKINETQNQKNVLAGSGLTAVIEDFSKTFKNLANSVEECYGMIKSNQMMINNLISLTGKMQNTNAINQTEQIISNTNNQLNLNNLSTEHVNEILIKYIISKNMAENQ